MQQYTFPDKIVKTLYAIYKFLYDWEFFMIGNFVIRNSVH